MKQLKHSLELERVLNGKVVFDPEFLVSRHSVFNDAIWDFNDGSAIRLNSVPAARLRINWGSYLTGDSTADADPESILLPEKIVHELKIFATLYVHVPEVFNGYTARAIKPQTAVIAIRALARLFSAIYRNSLFSKLGNAGKLSHIESIADIRLSDIRAAIMHSPFSDGQSLKRALRNLGSTAMAKYLVKGPLPWTVLDLDSIEFKFSKKRSDYKPVMPNDLFRMLSNAACGDVRGFLGFLGEESEDKAPVTIATHKMMNVADGRGLFEEYIRIRTKDRELFAELKKRHFGSWWDRKEFRENYGVSLQNVLDYIYRVQRAAYTVIGLYTGARYSDLTSFKIGCVIKHHGVYVFAGTLTKFEATSKLEGNDLWPAIPIMRDAIKCLEEISRVTFNPYLISGRDTVPVDGIPKPLSLTGLSGAINNYLREIDTSKRWETWHINPHQLRHTLANQLARADVGLMFIAHQMKHLYTALNALPPAATLMYGNLSDMATQRALQTGPAYLEAAQNLYDPDKPIAGGGAEDFKTRRKAYFEGMAAAGWEKDELIEHLAKQGMPFASVGVGYCGGRRDRILADGSRDLNPCLGSLQCNPSSCHQAVITKTHLSQWQKIYEHNMTLVNDERMSYARDVHLAAAEEARNVLCELNPELKH